MIIDCPNSQFISRNLVELAEVIIQFRELASVYPHVTMYMDMDSWEIFDTRRCLVLIRHDFKHVRQLSHDIRQLMHDVVNVSSACYHISSGSITLKEAVSVKHIFRRYGLDNYFFKSKLIKTYIYGKFKQKKDLADCMECD